MAIDARLRELAHRHRTLESELAIELKRPSSDLSRVVEIKKQKLRLKDEMVALETGA